MKVIFHKRFYEAYTHDPAAAAGRMEAIVNTLKGKFGFVETGPASEKDLEKVEVRPQAKQLTLLVEA